MKIKKDIPWSQLLNYGFQPDPANCEHSDDTYYHLNNWFIQINDDFRITILKSDRTIEILCLPEDKVVHNLWDLSVLYRLFKDGLVEEE